MTAVTQAFDARAQASAGPLPPGFLPRDCTFDPTDWAILARQWFPVARLADLADKPQAVTLLDLPLVVYRAGDTVRVARDLCPHRGLPLSMGWVEGEEIVCAYHGLRYGPDGQCRKIPAHPDLEPSRRLKVGMFPAVERYGLVWTCLDPSDETAAIPSFPLWDADGFQQIVTPFVDIAGSAARQMEGFVDVAHFAWVHHEAFADREDPVVPIYDTKVTDTGLRTDYWSSVSNYPRHLRHLAPPDFRWLRRFEIQPPFAAHLTIFFPGEQRLSILNLPSPVSARKTRLFVPLVRNFDTTGDVEDVYAFNAQIFAEDAAVVERQTPEELPLEPSEEAHFPADKTSLGYRRLLRGMGLTFRYVT
ncbi:Rieske 2Fe-2S domain-containing protein [Caulobacter hibisci]|uniref:Rieske 2Fe-2S domain-containing protein n=1 Tax=Caulobacter hibisci TaxID=2035993 RepID=A0ABS0T0U3_9CAUL|nr:Rieske 2Fe-2S domain-containing protein [Caulobacter hibisci]MBI1685141.1 Rieske 2Fe-2S domain-containing protein [Caulobacter hibisci]